MRVGTSGQGLVFIMPADTRREVVVVLVGGLVVVNKARGGGAPPRKSKTMHGKDRGCEDIIVLIVVSTSPSREREPVRSVL